MDLALVVPRPGNFVLVKEGMGTPDCKIVVRA